MSLIQLMQDGLDVSDVGCDRIGCFRCSQTSLVLLFELGAYDVRKNFPLL